MKFYLSLLVLLKLREMHWFLFEVLLCLQAISVFTILAVAFCLGS